MNLQLLLLTILLSVPVSPTTTMFFSGNIICRYAFPFSYEIRVMEEDNTTPDDHIGGNPLMYSTSSPSPFRVTAIDTLDGSLNVYLEIVFDIEHRCSFNQKMLKTRVPIARILGYPGSHYISNITIDITDKADIGGW